MSALKAHGLALADRVVDSEPNGPPSAMRVVDLPEETAEEYYIEAIGKTVAEANADSPADDPVVGVVYENDLDRAVEWWRVDVDEELQREHERAPEPKINPGPDHLAALAMHDNIDVTVYHYPESRLRTIGEDWEPPAGGSRSSGKREREEVFGEHPEDVEEFEEFARRAFNVPDVLANYIVEDLDLDQSVHGRVANAEAVLDDEIATGGQSVAPQPGPQHPVNQTNTPETRGGCRYTSDDSYKPDDPSALVCWECSNKARNRPRKFADDDPAGKFCEAGVKRASSWQLRNEVMESLEFDRLPWRLGDVYGEDGRGGRQLARHVRHLRSGEDDKIRRAALRISYEATLAHVEEYNYSRALALLRDRGVAQELPIIGDGTNGGDGQ